MKAYTFNQLSKKVQKSLQQYYSDCLVERKATIEEVAEYYNTGNGEGGKILFNKDGEELEEED